MRGYNCKGDTFLSIDWQQQRQQESSAATATTEGILTVNESIAYTEKIRWLMETTLISYVHYKCLHYCEIYQAKCLLLNYFIIPNATGLLRIRATIIS